MSKIVAGVALAAAITFTGGLAIAGLMSTGLLTGAALGTAVSVLNTFIVGALINGVVKQLTPGTSGTRPVATVEYSGTVEVRRILYGTLRLSGMNVIPPVTSGTNNKNLHQVLALTGHEVASIGDVYFGQDLISSASITAITGASTDGQVTSGAYANKAWIRRYLGTASQTADFILDSALSIWTSAHRGRGISYLAMQFEYDETVYKSGKPEVSAIVQGMKVYDPRLDSTNGGSGSQRIATPSTWTFSANPALCLANYLYDSTLGLGEDSARIDWPMVATAADHCDEQVAWSSGLFENRYTCNVLLLATANFEDNIGILVGSMLGNCLYSGGKWRMRAGVWDAPEFTLGDSDVAPGGVEYVGGYAYKDRFNGVRGTFMDPFNNYQPNEFPAVQNSTYVTADGESLFKDVQQAACSNVHEAQRNGILLTRKSRNGESAVVRYGMSAWGARPGMTGLVTITEIGWIAKSVRCEGWKFDPSGSVELALREELSSDWNDPVFADYQDPTHISNVTPVYYTPSPISALSASGTKEGVVLTWSAPGLYPTGTVFDIYEYTAATPFSSASLVGSTSATTFLLTRTDTITRYYWVVVRSPSGTVSSNYPPTNGLASAQASTLEFGYVTTGQAQVIADSIVKVGGSAAFDSSVYSIGGYKGGAFVSFLIPSAGTNVSIGLDSNPAVYSSNVINFALFCNAGTLYASEDGSNYSLGSYAANDVMTVTYDGSQIRYLRNGAVLRTRAIDADRVFYMDSSIYGPGDTADYVRFGPFGANAPSIFMGWGNVSVSDRAAIKLGGTTSWSEGYFYSRHRFASCHVGFKPSDNSNHFMVGLMQFAGLDAAWGNLDFAIYCDAGDLYVAEAGSLYSMSVTYGVADNFDITYDGTNARYYKNGALFRTTYAPGLYLFAGSAFYEAGGAVDSLRWGPSTNLAVTDTGQLGVNSATALSSTSVAGPTEGGVVGAATYTTIASLAVGPQVVDCEMVVTVVGEYECNTISSQWGMYGGIHDNTSGTGGTDRNLFWPPSAATNTYRGSYSLERRFQITAGAAPTFYFLTTAVRGSSSEHAYTKNVLLKAEVIKR